MTTEFLQNVVLLFFLAACVGEARRWRAVTRQRSVHSQLEVVLTASREAILWLDRYGRVSGWNTSASQLLKASPALLERCPVGKFFPTLTITSGAANVKPSTIISCLVALQRTETQVADAEGNLIPASVSVRQIENGGGFKYLVLIHDQSHSTVAQNELQRYADQLLLTKRALEQHNARLEESVALRTEELQRAKDEAEAANAAKTCFLSNMSHELRTPLHGILSFARFGLRRMDRSTKQQLLRYFQNIEDCGNTLLKLVNQLLDLAKLESGTTQLDLEALCLTDVVTDVVSEFKGLAEEKDIDLRIPAVERPPLVQADRDRVAQVLRNLISNALKFSPSGGHINIECYQEDQLVGVRVVDQGPGVPEEELEAVFDAFVQSSLTTSGAGGTGLGLAICRQIIELHGGSIRAENGASRGASFSFELPCNNTICVNDVATGSASSHSEHFTHPPLAVTQ